MCGKNYGVLIPRKYIEYKDFLLMPQFPTQNSRQNFLKICFPKQKGVEKIMTCLFYQNSIRKYEDDLEH